MYKSPPTSPQSSQPPISSASASSTTTTTTTTTATSSPPSNKKSLSPAPAPQPTQPQLPRSHTASTYSSISNSTSAMYRLCLAVLCLLATISIICPLHVDACGPGRGGGRRRMLKKYPPLVYKQHIPNVSENTLGASGRSEGKVRRQDKRFKELVQNFNQDIVFRDDEGTSADRMMTQRLKEKLSTLAISVMNQWPNVKLRVIEGWDEEGRHALNSLHYEGRAVDITTSDRDRSKYGMLARLAVEAGFDWVHYESRSHIHCSVKSEKSDSIRNNGCFDGSGIVYTPKGSKPISQVRANDQILTMNPDDGKARFSPVLMWLDLNESGEDLFVELTTESNLTIKLTSSHLIYVSDDYINYYPDEAPTANSNTQKQKTITNINSNNNNNHNVASININGDAKQVTSRADQLAYTTYARNAIVGQYLLTTTFKPTATNSREAPIPLSTSTNTININTSNDYTLADQVNGDHLYYTVDVQYADNQHNLNSDEIQMRLDKIVKINYSVRSGIYAPLTRDGNLIVNSVVASCYAVISDHDLAHLSFLPVRWYYFLKTNIFDRLMPPSTTNHLLHGGRLSFDKIESIKTNSLSRNTNTTDGKIIQTQSKTQDDQVGVHWYPAMLYKVARFLLPTSYLY